jgi:hypothetical protein
MMSHKAETAPRIAYALLAFVLGLLANVLYMLVPSETWVHVVGIVGTYPLLVVGLLVLSGRGPGGRLMLSGKGPSSRFMLTRRRWKYVVGGGLAAVSIIVGALSALDFLVHPSLPVVQWLLIASLANLIEPLGKNRLVENP